MKKITGADNNNALDLQQVKDQIIASRNEIDIIKLCSKIAKDLGISFFSYFLFSASNFHDQKYRILSDCNTRWTHRYKEKSYLLFDPAIRKCLQSLTPIFWNTQELNNKTMSDKAKTIIKEKHEYGLRAGIMVPVFDSKGISGVFELGLDEDLFTDQSLRYLEQIAPYASYLGCFIHQSIIKLLRPEMVGHSETLTRREIDCLTWVADGMTASEIGSKLYISENTVKFHSKNIIKKLEARNTAQALSIAIIRGLIKPVFQK